MQQLRTILEKTGTKIMGIALVIIGLFLLALFAFFFPYVEKALFDSRKLAAKNLVDAVYTMVADYEKQVAAGDMNPERARRQSLKRIRSMRFTNNGYVWINDTTEPYPRMIMHPVMPELEGRVMDDAVFDTASKIQPGLDEAEIVLPGGDKNIFHAFLEVAQAQGQGFVTYEWYRPSSSGISEDLFAKSSYVRLFEPWDWVIGSGVYIDDVYAQIRQLKWAIISVTAGILLIALLGTLVLMRTITKPIKQLARFATEVSGGHLNAAIKGRFTGEMRQLKESISRMVVELQSRMQEAEARAREAAAAELELRKSEEKYRLIFENAPLGVLHFDEGGVITACNDIFVDIIGSSRQALVGLNMLKLRDQKIVAALTRALAGEFAYYEGVYESVTADKQTPVRAHFAPFRGLEGRVLGGVGLVEDITERHRAEAALRESEEKYRILVENAQEAIYVAQDGMLRFANKRSSELTGYLFEEITNTSFDQFIHPEDREMVVARHYNRMQGIETDSIYSFRIITRSGNVRWVELKVVAIEWQGRPATLNFLSDITERKEAQSARQKLERRLRQAQKMEAIGTLTGGVAHDFNNILSIIMGYTELVQGEVPEGDIAGKGLREIKAASLRAKDVIRQLLTFSRKGDEAQAPQDIGLIIKEGMRMMRSTIPSSVDINTRINRDLPKVMANPTQIHQLIVNLCKNASDAMLDNGGTLAVRLEPESLDDTAALSDPELTPGDYVKLTVSDTGHGIAGPDLDRIFDPYFTTKDVDKGTGLGLSVVLGIVQAHGGVIRVESAPDRGTLFEVFFPVADGEMAAPAEEPRQNLPTGTERILFVDDELSVVHLNQIRMEKLGFRVFSETDPQKALERFQANPERFDLVITDMTMPKMTGDMLSREILRIRPAMKIILCTGYSEKISEATAASIGIARFIEKPVAIDTLAAAARAVLDGE